MDFEGLFGEVLTEGCGFGAEMNFWESDEASDLRLCGLETILWGDDLCRWSGERATTYDDRSSVRNINLIK